MNTFREVCDALRLDSGVVKSEYNRSEGTFRLFFEPHALTAREENEKVILEAVSGEKTARREYSFDEAHKVLSALLDGSARPEVHFPFEKKKKKNTGVIGAIFGWLLAALSGIATLGITAAQIEYGTSSTLGYFAMLVFFGGMTLLGIALAVLSGKGKLSAPSRFGLGAGTAIVLVMLSLILGIWSTRPGDNETPLAAYISLTVVFSLCIAGGAALAVFSVRADTGSDSFVGYPSLRVLPSKENVRRVVAAMKEKTARQAVSLKPDFNRQPSLYQSKLGGLPYWDPAKPYPCADDGSKLMLLAQFNLSELPPTEYFPAGGMLQFFLYPDDEFGVGYGCEVVYHSTIDRNIRVKNIEELGVTCPNLNPVDFPVSGEIALDFELRTVYMNCTDGSYDDLLSSVAAELGVGLFDGISIGSLNTGLADDPLNEAFDDCGSCLAGYPYFVQYDHRSAADREKYDLALLSLGSETCREDSDRYVMWGDCGTANFLINSEALKRMELDDVLYEWDCF